VVQCLDSLSGEVATLRGGRVIVVDNASGDASVAVIAAAIEDRGWGAWAEVIEQPRNGGFAYGNNRGLERVRQLDPDFTAVVCLNPDALVRPDAIAALLGHLEGHADAGIAGASIEDEHGQRQRSAHPFPSPLGELDGAAQLGMLSRLIRSKRSPATGGGAAPQRCDWVSGACMAIRREVLDRIGPLDEGYFLYFEETDFCYRAQRAGFSCWYVPAAQVVHREGASTGIREAGRRRPAYWFASRRRFFAKVHGLSGLVAADVLWSLGRASLVLRRALGLGGRAKLVPEPRRFALDLLTGDARAIFRGELRKLRSSAKGMA
jgi:GT2 family glycosyltransferase